MRAYLRSTFSKLLAGSLTAAVRTIRQDSLALTCLPSHLAFSENFEGTLARLTRYGDEFVDLLLDLDRLKEVNDQSDHSAETATLCKPAMIIDDLARDSAPPRTGDLHDVTGHHRYYGNSAYNGGLQLVP
jgi:GGDEF domain-containing protein